MGTKDITINIEIESICKITCFNTNCKHKLKDSLFCNLKNVEINEEEQCANFDEIIQFVVAPSSVPVGSTLDTINRSNPLSDYTDASGCGHDHK